MQHELMKKMALKRMTAELSINQLRKVAANLEDIIERRIQDEAEAKQAKAEHEARIQAILEQAAAAGVEISELMALQKRVGKKTKSKASASAQPEAEQPLTHQTQSAA